MEITTEMVKRLIKEQFPKWSHLKIYPVEKSGHDNRTFHLGKELTVRLPSAEEYAGQIEKESRWLPYLQEHLDYPVSKSVAVGKPTDYYPFPWSVNCWIQGETLLECPAADKKLLAQDLADALRKLQAVGCEGGPGAGVQNFYRGGSLKVYEQETQEALEKLKDRLPTEILGKIWNECIAESYNGQPVWVHGDVAPGNILMREQRFWGLIDFGVLGTGDPACDYAMAWTYFDTESRKIFLQGIPEDMVKRARGWALWKALITYEDADPYFRKNAEETVRAILYEHQHGECGKDLN